ncbi:MAG: ATP-binding cassette, subfamily multidrug efflux pump [Candidatus Sumerlaeota bacterium]|nr:ATP-binding cassette, subfamily multidrug efflux pump [Candidatus Sumerlaeota bacterium]
MSEKTQKQKALEKRLKRLGLDLQDEEVLEKIEDWRQVKRLFHYLAPRRKRVAAAVALSILLSLLMLAPSILTQIMVDKGISKDDFQGVIWLSLGLVGTQLFMVVIEAFTSYMIARIGQETMRDLRMDLFRQLTRHSLAFFDKKPVGWLVTRMTSDVNVLNELFAQGVVGIFQQIFLLAGIVIVLFLYNWQLALWSMLVMPLVFLLSYFFRRAINVSYRLTRLRLSRLNTHVQENVTGMRTVQANTRESRQFGIFQRLNDQYRDAHYRSVFAFATFFPLIDFISALGLALIIWQGGKMYLQDYLTIGELILFVTLLERFFFPIRDLSEKFNLVQSAIAASERLFKLMDEKPDVQDPVAATPHPGFHHSIEFRDVWFAYKDENWILKGVSFRIERGQNVAIVGPTGSGKTTMMSLLCRFYDVQKGAILIDGIDIREMTQQELRSKIAIVMQDVFLFKGSVAENISLGDKTIDIERIHAAAKNVEADTFIRRLPSGYDTNVRERGATLSVGQKQLLSFARALACEPDILILDEATSSIDTETEKLIQAALDRLTAGRTSLIIAHRLSTIQQADNILVLHHGHLSEQGTHRQLLAQDGLYRRLYELQYREQSEAEPGLRGLNPAPGTA